LFYSIKNATFAVVIELERHIEILLLSNDCVIVPDLGGFMAHHVDAVYDEKEHLFIPPLRTIGFNPQLKMNDSLLAQSYIEAYDISYPDALARIEDEVSEVKQHLGNEGSYEFNDIGVLSLNEDGNYQFEPCEAGILTPDLYGLSSFEMKPIGEVPVEIEKTVPTLSVTTANTVKTDNEETEKEDKVTVLPFPELDEEDDDERTISIRVSMLRNIAAVFIAVVAFFLWSDRLGNKENSNLLKSKIDTGFLTHVMPKDVTTNTVDLSHINASQTEQTQETHPAETQEKKQEPVTEQKEEGNFAIVLASHVPVANAESYVSELKRKGYTDARVWSHPNASTKVLYGSFATESEARNKLSSLSNISDFSEGWILKIH
jgi:septal ring-binding cell division protein DamX